MATTTPILTADNLQYPPDRAMLGERPEMLAAFEKVFTVVMLFYTTDAVVPLVTSGGNPVESMQTGPVDMVIKAVLYAMVLFFVALRWRTFLRSAWDIRWVLAAVGIAIVSAAWSQDPALTLRGSAVLVATTAFGLYFGIRYTIPQQLRLLCWTFFLAIVLSFFFAVFLPIYGIDQGPNYVNWRGVFLQKNMLGQAMVLAMFVFFFARTRTGPALRWTGIALALLLLFLSGSATGIFVSVAILLTLPVCRLVRKRFTLVIPALLGIGLVIGGLMLTLKTGTAVAMGLVHRSTDLTGRTELWNAVMLAISKRPWLGYGFSAFWLGMRGASESVLKSAGWMAGYAHNGFLDVLLQTGFLGLAAFAIGYLILWRRALVFLLRARGPIPVWLCMFLAFMFFYNLTEGSILVQNSIYWVLYIAVAIGLYRYMPGQSMYPGKSGPAAETE